MSDASLSDTPSLVDQSVDRLRWDWSRPLLRGTRDRPLAAAHLGDIGEELSQDADRPFAPQGGLAVGLGHHQPIEGLKESFLLAPCRETLIPNRIFATAMPVTSETA